MTMEGTEIATDGNQETEDVDALIEIVENPKEEIAPPVVAEPPAWDPKPWEFDWNGKRITPESQDRVKQWASQGYNYSQRMGEFNKTKLQMEIDYANKQKAIKEQEEKFAPFVKVDEYAKKNPDWWKHTLSAYEQAQQQVDPKIQSLEQRLIAFEQAQEQRAAAEAATKQAEEAKHYDDLLNQQIEATRKSFPTHDLDAVDPASGKTVVVQVFEHAAKIGTGNFEVAYRDLFFPKLLEEARSSGKEALVKTTELNAKKGITVSPTPKKSPDSKPAPRGKWTDPQFSPENLIKSMGF